MGIKPIKVSQVNAYIKRVLQSDPLLGGISVIGEISNLKFHSSGHVYFSLKDEFGKLNCFLPDEIFEKIRYDLADGIEIIASGYISVFEKNGAYSLTVKNIAVEGAGGLAAAFERLKSRLASDGLFDEKNKKKLPAFPSSVAIVTSSTGAALQDILKIISGRNNCVDIIICPVQVQGTGAAEDIAAGIRMLNRLYPETDCMIVGRGGGSAEELWAFNEEIVARSIFASNIPVVSAVGHETDFTIADFVADLRAETPSAAAQTVVPDTRALLEFVNGRGRELKELTSARLENLTLRLKRNDMEYIAGAAFHRMDETKWRIKEMGAEMRNALETSLKGRLQTTKALAAELESLNPRAVLERGYAILEDRAGNIISSVNDIRKGETLTAVLYDGSAELTAASGNN
ncbi:MAG: exodeoxyribonuclease VII large subunit [Clostridiales Family XIII bacterium]|jgi:exodeoxyribonuclease VII large subunit|nr:exodeoxyribonuclease VII large subunit [Clostridiales Family XIII bacterium]